MTQIIIDKKKSISLKNIILVGCISYIAYWIVSFNINVYSVTLMGVVYEMLWLPMIGLSFIMPLCCLYFWHKDRFSIKSLYLYLMIAGISLLAFMLTR